MIVEYWITVTEKREKDGKIQHKSFAEPDMINVSRFLITHKPTRGYKLIEWKIIERDVFF